MGNCVLTRGGGIKPVILNNLSIKPSSSQTVNLDISSLYTNYNKLSINDIIIEFKSAKLASGASQGSTFSFNYSYNSSTGVITISTGITFFSTNTNSVGNVIIYKNIRGS